MRYARIVRAVMTTPWAILPAKLEAIVELVALKAAGGDVSDDQVRLVVGAARGGSAAPAGGAVAVVPIYGTITQRAGLLDDFSGGTSTEAVAAALRQALGDPNVGSILLDIDSPGGGVSGVDELAAEIQASRGGKPIVAIANSLAASAAYWLASAADEVVVTPGGEVGSIGVLAAHEDVSAALAAEGVTLTLISAGAYKTEGNPYEPLGDEARQAIQARVDEYYAMFVDRVARGRGVTAKQVRDGFGQGRVVGAKEAVALGMADRVATFDETARRLARGAGGGGRARAEARARALRLVGITTHDGGRA